jgi:hypothetical protein
MLNLSQHGECAVGVIAKVEVLICRYGGDDGQNRYRNSLAHAGILKIYSVRSRRNTIKTGAST